MFIELNKNVALFKLVELVSTKLNTPAYVVGGYVRDLLMGNESKDIDITLIGNSKEFCEELKKLMEVNGDTVKLAVYETYGTVSLSSKKYGEVEFVTARNESYSRESRNPQCEPGTLEEDLRRRDFTINAMAVSLNEKSFGELVDMFNGYEDLKNKIIRTPIEPESTFTDDPLRMLRAIRFASKYNFKIDDVTYKSICESAHRITLIVKERVESEIDKILRSDNPDIGISLLNTTGVIHYYMCKGMCDNIIKGVVRLEYKFDAQRYKTVKESLDELSVTSKLAVLRELDEPRHEYMIRMLWAKFILALTPYVNDVFVMYGEYYNTCIRLGHSRKNDIESEWDILTWYWVIANEYDSDVKPKEFMEVIFKIGKDAPDIIFLLSRLKYISDRKANKLLEKIKIFEGDGLLKGSLDITGTDIQNIMRIKPSKLYGVIMDMIENEVFLGKIKNEKEDIIKYLQSLTIQDGTDRFI